VEAGNVSPERIARRGHGKQEWRLRQARLQALFLIHKKEGACQTLIGAYHGGAAQLVRDELRLAWLARQEIQKREGPRSMRCRGDIQRRPRGSWLVQPFMLTMIAADPSDPLLRVQNW